MTSDRKLKSVQAGLGQKDLPIIMYDVSDEGPPLFLIKLTEVRLFSTASQDVRQGPTLSLSHTTPSRTHTKAAAPHPTTTVVSRLSDRP